MHEREPHKKKIENVLIPPANLSPVVCARENLSYSKKKYACDVSLFEKKCELKEGAGGFIKIVLALWNSTS